MRRGSPPAFLRAAVLLGALVLLAGVTGLVTRCTEAPSAGSPTEPRSR